MKEKLYNGSTKILYHSLEDCTYIMGFTDKIILDNKKSIEIAGKGAMNNNISSFIMSKLEMIGIENHFIEKLNMREQLIQSVEIFPIQVSITSVACGRFVEEFSMEEGYVLDYPIIDFKIRNHKLNYPIINEHQMLHFGWLKKKEIEKIKTQAIRIYDFLTGLFVAIGIRLVQCEMEFGKVFNGEEFVVMLADEITPDTCRLWDIKTNEKLGRELINIDIHRGLESYKTIDTLLK